jgi:hypothetical protein
MSSSGLVGTIGPCGGFGCAARAQRSRGVDGFWHHLGRVKLRSPTLISADYAPEVSLSRSAPVVFASRIRQMRNVQRQLQHGLGSAAACCAPRSQ